MKYLFALLILCTFSSIAQDKYDEAGTYFDSNPKKSIVLLEEYVSEDLSDEDYAKAYYALSYLYHYQNVSLEKALVSGFKALHYFDRLSDLEGEEKTLRHISQIHLKAKNFDESREYSNLALSYSINENKTAQNHHNLGIANLYSANFDQAVHHYTQAISFYEKQNDQNKICELIIELGLVEFYKENYSGSISFYTKAHGKALEWKLLEWQSRALNNIGNAYLIQGKYTEALKYLKQSVALEYDNDAESKLGATYNLAKIYFDQRKLDSANIYVMKAIKSYSNLHDIPQYFDALDLRKQIAISRMDIDSAMYYLNMESDLAKELLALKGDLQLQNTQLLVSWKETQKRNLDLSNRYKTLQDQRNWLIGGGIVFLVIILGLVIKLRKDKRK
jgi:tetratricopeptide (TPR) repeat protein